MNPSVPPKSQVIFEAFDPSNPPGDADSILGVFHRLVRHHEGQWDAEDRSRVPGMTLEQLGRMKKELDELNRQRLCYVDGIDGWLDETVVQNATTAPHTETYGVIVDRLAIAWVRCEKLPLNDSLPPGKLELATAQLNDLATAYDVLIDNVTAGHRRFPNWRTFKVYAPKPAGSAGT